MENSREFIKVMFNFNEPLIDKRIKGKSWMTKMKVKDYLSLVDIAGNSYQRNLQSLSFYRKLIEDLINDTTMPPISVVYPDTCIDFDKGLNVNKKFIILDGLQRTNCLLECRAKLESGKVNSEIYKSVEEFDNKLIYVEIWEKLSLKDILYKMVVLNTGQKKMDYEHQLDILISSIRNDLDEIGVKYYTNNEKAQYRGKTGVLPLSIIASALVSYINKSPIKSKKNAAEYLFNEFDLNIESGEAESTLNLINSNDTYSYLKWALVDFNNMLEEKYKENNPLIKYDVFLISLMASLGFSYNKNSNLLNEKIRLLQEKFKVEEDPIKIRRFEMCYKSFKTGIGDKRRRFIFNSFKYYFISPIYDDDFNWDEDYANER